mmetsp:Transcript_30890/g.47354  ORF Transcript_30890/g.47354 Transcript_30890/m.47354 type:complete len:519 (+) Transcript_30890:82-1638(+)|eukprot:CAMPEP_0118712158 /NCGR_PEP_ID=MMETSP0800-20121206/24605_1 /TAXON_ID=210618 ORGANISM="Striatella unipunctata, Strain CCMP2910" /NCGR_SAMPLE_ID=MMETSP0800 /ASSEMBLY_ACC=CAM_ASM_000638 /LENGTH=518 /DNA_ID=CAMNT_0006617067 /DNA_START=53 /DNA_END=1609 /DNA_ORIENTATION=+
MSTLNPQTRGSIPSHLKDCGEAFLLQDGIVFIHDTSGIGESIYFDLQSFARIRSVRVAFGTRHRNNLGHTRTTSNTAMLQSRYLFSATGDCYDVIENRWLKPFFRSRLGNIEGTSMIAINRETFPNSDALLLCPDGKMYSHVWGRNWNDRPRIKDAEQGQQAEAGLMLMATTTAALWIIYNGCEVRCYEKGYWTYSGSLEVPRKGGSLVTLSDRFLLLIGGVHLGVAPEATQPVLEIEVFDTQTKQGVIIGELEESEYRKGSASAVCYNDKIYLFSGGRNSVLEFSRTEILALCPDLPDSEYGSFASPADPPSTIELPYEVAANKQPGLNQKRPHLMFKAPKHPVLPPLPSGDTMAESVRALDRYCQQLDALDANYIESIQKSIDHVRQVYDTARDQEICLLEQRLDDLLRDSGTMRESAKSAIEIKTEFMKQIKDAPLELLEDDHYDDSIPSQLRCPITLELMTEPVVASDGNTYEKHALDRWFTKHTVSPLTGAPLPTLEYFPCHALRALCRQFAQ